MQATLVKFFIQLLALLPFRIAYLLGSMLGYLVYLIPNSLQKPAKTNIDLCFPELTAKQRARIYKDSFIELGRVAAETGALLLWNKNRTFNLVKKVSGIELFEEALTRNKGVIIAAPHHGAWEMMGLYCSVKFNLTSLYRPLRISKLDPIVKQARERFGARLVPTNASGVRALYKALENNQLAGPSFSLNGKQLDLDIEKGYVNLNRTWKKGDVIHLDLPMQARIISAHENVDAKKDLLAVQYGPLVYCAEEIDNQQDVLEAEIGESSGFVAAFKPGLLGGINVLEGESLNLIPYYSWANRGSGKMNVWFNRSQ